MSRLPCLALLSAALLGAAVARAQAPTGSAPIRLSVRVPADATLIIDGRTTTSTGPVRRFESPPVELGKTYTYYLNARWTEAGKHGDAAKLIGALDTFDEAVALQTASLLRAKGVSLQDEPVRKAAKKTGPHVVRAFRGAGSSAPGLTDERPDHPRPRRQAAGRDPAARRLGAARVGHPAPIPGGPGGSELAPGRGVSIVGTGARPLLDWAVGRTHC